MLDRPLFRRIRDGSFILHIFLSCMSFQLDTSAHQNVFPVDNRSFRIASSMEGIYRILFSWFGSTVLIPSYPLPPLFGTLCVRSASFSTITSSPIFVPASRRDISYYMSSMVLYIVAISFLSSSVTYHSSIFDSRSERACQLNIWNVEGFLRPWRRRKGRTQISEEANIEGDRVYDV